MSLKVSDFEWATFKPDLIDPNLVKIIKASSLIESNAAQNNFYLKEAFAQDPFFLKKLTEWIKDEVQHGMILAKWVQKADPQFNFENSLKRFQKQLTYPLDCTCLTRHSLRRELLRKCVVKTGTSSFYKALSEQTTEPLLKSICRKIAAEELRHYKFFCFSLKRYLVDHPLPVWRRAWVALKYFKEKEREELASAYFAANTPQGSIYHYQFYHQAYWDRILSCYQPHHFKHAVVLLCKAVGLNPCKLWLQPLERSLWWLMRHNIRKSV